MKLLAKNILRYRSQKELFSQFKDSRIPFPFRLLKPGADRLYSLLVAIWLIAFSIYGCVLLFG